MGLSFSKIKNLGIYISFLQQFLILCNGEERVLLIVCINEDHIWLWFFQEVSFGRVVSFILISLSYMMYSCIMATGGAKVVLKDV